MEIFLLKIEQLLREREHCIIVENICNRSNVFSGIESCLKIYFHN